MNFDSARQSQIEAKRSERGRPFPVGKADEEDRFGKVAASQNSHNWSGRSIYIEQFFESAFLFLFFLYRNNLKNREFDKEASQNSYLERATIVLHQGASEDEDFEKKPTPSKPDSSGCFGIYIESPFVTNFWLNQHFT